MSKRWKLIRLVIILKKEALLAVFIYHLKKVTKVKTIVNLSRLTPLNPRLTYKTNKSLRKARSSWIRLQILSRMKRSNNY